MRQVCCGSACPDETLTMRGESSRGGKQAKDRITLPFCTNTTGSEKLPLLLIGRFSFPRCFKMCVPCQCSMKQTIKHEWLVICLLLSLLN